MNLFGGIFRKRSAGTEAASEPVLDMALDDSLLALERELSGLAELPVSPAAMERGWARLERELERRPVRTAQTGSRVAARRSARPTRGRTWRWALGPAAAAVAVIATLLGVYGGGLLQTADSGDRPTPVTSVVSSDSTAPPTTPTTDGTTPDTVGPGTTGVQPGTTQGPVPTDGTVSTDGTGGGTGTTGGSVSPTTTKPPSPGTTGDTQYAAAEREGSAKAVAIFLADMVITGNSSAARALVAPEAQSSLAQMMMSLNEPYGYRFTGLQSLSGDVVRVTLDINDRVADGQGQLVEVLKHFVIKVRVDSEDAVIVAINAGS